MKRLLIALLMGGSSLAMADRAAEELYPKTCGVCHTAAVAGAPKPGDTAAWQPRLDAKGMDGLLQTVQNGLNAMPPKGMCMDCNDAEFKALMRQLITYMMEDPRTISRCIELLFVAKAIERIGDHAKNMAQYAVYMAKGEDVRHGGIEAIERAARD